MQILVGLTAMEKRNEARHPRPAGRGHLRQVTKTPGTSFDMEDTELDLTYSTRSVTLR